MQRIFSLILFVHTACAGTYVICLYAHISCSFKSFDFTSNYDFHSNNVNSEYKYHLTRCFRVSSWLQTPDVPKAI